MRKELWARVTGTIGIVAMSLSSFGQGSADAHVRLADHYYKQMAYAAAIPEYRAAADEGAVNEHVTKRLADCYMRTGDTENAEVWYAQVVKFLNREPADLYNYAQALKSNAKYDQAEEWMDRYLAAAQPEGQPTRSNITDFALKFSTETDRFTVRPVAINTPYTDMGTAWLGTGTVIFSSARHATVGIERTAAWNGQPFLDLFVADRAANGDLEDPRLLSGDVNSKLHEGPVVCSTDQQTLWLTRNNRVKSQNGVNRLSLYRAARKNNDAWVDLQPFAYNNSETSVGHPALTPDGRRLYFVSDMPGGFGGTDLYVCTDQGGQWSEPENLGAAVNTVRNELFPFAGADGTLYFASEGHPGLGGLDIFAVPPVADGSSLVTINVGAPVNSSRDDFAFIIDAQGQGGYFSSNRPGGQGDDDIYVFEMHRPLEQRYLCTGYVIDEENETPLIDVEVRLLDPKGSVLETTMTDAKGAYSFAVQKDREYRVVASMKGRYDGEQHLSTENIEQQQILARDIHLIPDAGIFLRGAVRHKGRLGFIPEMTVSVVNLSSFFTESQATGEGGDFLFRLQPNEEYEVLFEKAGYFSMSMPVATIGMRQGVIDLGDARDLSFREVEVGKAVPFEHIRWALGSEALDVVARTELDAFAEQLEINPAINVEIAVHCDARGDATANQALTQKRAGAIVEYLKTKGVAKDRMTANGYGASRLLNHCAPGVQCSEEEHAVNRRTEFVVTSISP